MDRQSGWLTSGAFAAFCGTTRETLRHYRDIRLLTPAHQGENGYFYYDVNQFYDFYAISIFRQTGTPLEEIRSCLQGQDAARTLSLLRNQRERLAEERTKLEEMEFVLSGMVQNLELSAAPDGVPGTAHFQREHLLAIPAEELEKLIPSSASEEERLIAVLERCRDLCSQYGLRTDYQLGAIHRPGAQVGQGTISHLYIRLRDPADLPWYWEKPAGTYLYLCCRGRWDLSDSYAALSRHIRSRGLRTTGGFYSCDLAGFVLNGVEENAASLISVRLA